MSEEHWLPVSWIMNISQASNCSEVQGKKDPYLLSGGLREVGSDICSSEGSWLLPLSDSCQSPFPLTYDTSWSELHCNCHLSALLTSWSACERRRASQSRFWVIRGWICTHQHHLEELTASKKRHILNIQRPSKLLKYTAYKISPTLWILVERKQGKFYFREVYS